MKKNELFELIKSLSKSEKRYFKVFCKQMGDSSVYVKLFDALDNQESFDEEAIRKKFAGEKFLKQLHVVKNYLRQMILKSLRNYHAALSKDGEAKDLLRNIEIMFNKELFQQCETELVKVERIARKHELKSTIVEVANWKRKLEQALRPHNYERLEVILEEQQQAIDVLQNAHAYWKLAVELSGRISARSGANTPHIPLLSDVRNAKSVEAKVLFFNTRYVNYIQNGKPDEAANALSELLSYLERNETVMKEDPAMYLSTLNNLLSYHVFREEFALALEMIGHSRGIFDRGKLKGEKKSLIKQYLRTCNIELEIYRRQKSWEEHAAFIESMEGFVMQHKAKMPGEYLLSFWFQFAYLRFVRKQMGEALKWANLIINTKMKGIRDDLQMQARMLNLMIHLEQRNYFVLRYFVDSTRRYFKKMTDLKQHEQVLFKFFIKMGRSAPHEWKTNFMELKSDFDKIGQTDPSLQNSYIDYNSWIDGHVL